MLGKINKGRIGNSLPFLLKKRGYRQLNNPFFLKSKIFIIQCGSLIKIDNLNNNNVGQNK